MKSLPYILVLVMIPHLVVAQLDNPDSSVKFEVVEDDFKSPEGLELPQRKIPSLSDVRERPKISLDLEEAQPFDMTQHDGLIDYKTDKAPKAFTKDKEAKSEYGRNVVLGDIKTGSQLVHVKYRDHEFVDGDRIRVYVNDDVVQSNVSLYGAFRGFKLPLQSGINRVVFEALNQGTSGPNTAELHVYDDEGRLISAKEWNLLTGNTATIIIIKE